MKRFRIALVLLLPLTLLPCLAGEHSFSGQMGQEIKLMIGTPYVWGGESRRGADCSGAIYYLFKRAGRPFPRMTARKMRAVLCPGPLHHYRLSSLFDLVWWTFTPDRPFGHVGIMDGDRLHFYQAGVHSGFARRCFCVPGGYWDRAFAGCGTWE